MTPITPRTMITWSLIALGLAAAITFLIQWLLARVEKVLPTWTLDIAKKQLARAYPNMDVYQAVSFMIRRDRSFSLLLGFLPWQCLVALFVLATLWAYVIPENSPFWLSLVQNLFIFEFMILALYPAFRLLQKIQRLTISRLHELLKKKSS